MFIEEKFFQVNISSSEFNNNFAEYGGALFL